MRVRSLVAAVALAAGLLVAGPAQPRAAAETDGTLVVAALRVLEQHYFQPVDPAALLNSAIGALRNAAGLTSDKLPGVPAGTAETQAVSMFLQRFDEAARAGKVSKTELAYHATQAMLASLHDDDTFYLKPADYSELKKKEAGTGVWAGIGVNIRSEKDATGVGWIFVKDVYPDSPAEAAGLKRFDRILEVAGQSVRDAADTDVSSLLRGQPGSTVSLLLQRGGQRLSVSLVRTPIRLLPRAQMIRPGIFYLKIYYFAKGTGDEVRQLLHPLLSQPIRAVILDLRGNGGGYRSEQQSVAGVFLPSQAIIGRAIQHAGTVPMVVSGESLLPSARMVVLADRYTTPAVLLVGLRALHRATIIGEKVRGIGGYGADFELPAGGVHATFEMIVGPNGEPIQGVEISPDVEVALTVADMERAMDPPLDAALTAAEK